MRIGITDSGTGGLSVCAEVEAGLRESPVGQDLEILYLNAALQDDYSYNAMPTRQDKLEAFDLFLGNVREKYRPDLLFIACNSLSVLFEDLYFDPHRQIPIEGIVEAGMVQITRALDENPATSIIVFATPTTVEEGSYVRRLVQNGTPPGRIVQQACPGLPDSISNDFSGGQARDLLQGFVPEALARFASPPEQVAAFLGCTHYGYQAKLFKDLLEKTVCDVGILNPNQAAAREILDSLETGPASGEVHFRFISPYAVPDKPLRSLSHYLGKTAPATVAALQNFEQDPGLYAA
jgi:glutamate racemase